MLAERVAEAVHAEKATVGILEGDMLHTRGSHGFATAAVEAVAVRVVPRGDGIAERVLFGDMVFIGDLDKDSRYANVIAQMGVRNAIGLAWRAGDVLHGALAAYDSSRPGGFDADDALVLELAAEVSAFVFRHRMLRARAAWLLRLSEELGRADDFAAMAVITTSSVRAIFPGVDCAIAAVARDQPNVIQSVALPAALTGRIPHEAVREGTLAGGVAASGEPFETDELEKASVFGPALLEAGYRRIRSEPVAAGRPLPDGRTSLGAISFISRSTQPFSPDDRDLMHDIARRLGLVAHRAELLRLEEVESAGMRAAVEAAIEIGSSLQPRDVIARLLKHATKVLNADRATLASIDGDELVIQGSFAIDGGAFDVGNRYVYRTTPQFMRVIELRQPLREAYRIDEVEADVRDAMAGFRHAITVPIVDNDRVVAVITVSRRADREFSGSDGRVLDVVAAAAGIALQNARLFDETVRGRQSLELTLEAAEDIAAAEELDDVIAKLLVRACAATGASEAVLGHIEGGDIVVDHATDRDRAGARSPLALSIVDELSTVPVQRQQPVGDSGQDGELWALYVPLVVRGETAGVMELRRAGMAFSGDDVDAVRRLAPMAALLVRNARLLDEARQASRAKSEFLNLAGHELRTPLAVIRGYLSLISSGAYDDSPTEWSAAIEVLQAKSGELTSMVESILIAARMQAGRLEANVETVELTEVVKQAVERSKAVAILTGGTVAARYPSDRIDVRADERHLAVIVDNLLANAVKYSSPPAVVTLALTSSNGVAELRVTDRGRGIPVEDRERIFEQFERIQSFDLGYPAGTGLGLYIARQLAERYDGTLTLEWSEPGQGSTFVLQLPMAKEGR
jgi:signal transduction histidine kinase